MILHCRYADWPELKGPLLSHLSAPSDSVSSTDLVEILVPGCGSSRLSEFIYDAGFRRITNVDFSKVVISDMLRRYVRSRPEMKWRIMDMTNLQVINTLCMCFCPCVHALSMSVCEREERGTGN